MITSEYIASSRASRPSAGQPADPLLNRHHQLYVIAAGNIVMAGFGVMWFGQTARFPLTPGSTILIVLSGAFLVAGLCAIVAGLATRAQGRQERDVVTEIQRHIDEATAGGVQTIGRVADVEATVTRIEAVVEERLRVLVDASAEQRQTLGELETRVQEGRKEGRKSAEVLDESFLKVGARVDEVRQLIEGRLVELERRAARVEHVGGVEQIEAMARRYADLTRTFAERLMAIETTLQRGTAGALDEDDLRRDDRYLSGYADGLAGRAIGDGKVIPLSGNGNGLR